MHNENWLCEIEITMEHYFENKVEVIGFAGPRIGKVLKFRGHEVSEEF